MDIDFSILNNTNNNSDTWDSATFEDTKKRLDITIKMLEGYNVSEEGLGTGLLKVFIGVADAFLKIGNTFKTNVFKFWKDLKRSEIRAYWESSMLAVKTVESQNVVKFMDLSIDVPTGMTASYLNTIEYLNNIYNTTDLVSYASVLYKELISVRSQLVNSKQEYRQGFKQLADTASMKEDALRKVIAQQNKYFTDKNVSDKQLFKNAYGSMQNLKNTRCKLMDMESYLGATNQLVGLIDNIDTCIGDITNYLSEDTEVDRVFVEQLARTVRFLATAFDVYGNTAMRQMACEHNLTINYEQLYKQI